MKKEELDRIIEKIENENSKEKAFFGVHRMDSDDEAYIKANKDGLELYANELLKASRSFDEIIENPDKNIITINSNEKWITGDIWLGYIEPKAEDRIDFIDDPNKSNWKDKFVQYGCILAIGIGAVIFIVGLFSIISWFK